MKLIFKQQPCQIDATMAVVCFEGQDKGFTNALRDYVDMGNFK